MKVAFYKTNSKGWSGIFDRLIRWRLKGRYSHCEIIFERSDGVSALMPDYSAEVDARGAVWCATSTYMDKMPEWSPRRVGRHGGVRFKRIVLDPNHWDIFDMDVDRETAYNAALWFKSHQGSLYDLRSIIGYLAWLIPQDGKRFNCSEACAYAMNLPQPWRFDPCNLQAVLQYANQRVHQATEPLR